MLRCVALILLAVAHIGNADTNNLPDVEILCSTPEYEVVMTQGAVVVSTTVFDLSLTTAKIRARHRLLKYFRGANDQGLEIPVLPVSGIQTYVPTDLFREVTLFIPLPPDLWDNIPKPLDSKVKIDKMPRSISYRRSVKTRAALGFSVEREAKKLFQILKKNGEPYWDDEDYYYIGQTKSILCSTPEYEVVMTQGAVVVSTTVFDLSLTTAKIRARHRLLKYFRGANDQGLEIPVLPVSVIQTYVPTDLFREVTLSIPLPPDLWDNIPKPLDSKSFSPENWEKLDTKLPNVDSYVDLTRAEPGENFCNAPRCPWPEYKVIQKYDSPMEKREYPGLPLVFAAAPTCHLDAAYGMAQRAIYDKLNASGLVKGKPFRLFDSAMGRIYQKQPGEDECNKVFVQSILVPEDVLASEKLPDFLGQEPFDDDIMMDLKVYRRNYPGPITGYVRHFGGFADEEEIYRQGKALREDLDSRGLCYLSDTLYTVEYNRGSRMFDRHNEVMFLAYEAEQCKPEKILHLEPPSHSDEMKRRDLLFPSLDDLCRDNECAERQPVRRFENFIEEKVEIPGSSVCAKQKFCNSVREATKQAVSKLLSYFNGYNKQQQRMDMPRPLFHYINLTSIGKPGCNKEMMTCSFVPKRFAADPPAPVGKDVIMYGATELNGYVMPFGDLNDDQIISTMIGFNKTLAGLEKFGIEYDKLTFGIMEYFAEDEGFEHNALFVPKLQKGIVVAEELYACVEIETCNNLYSRKAMVALHDYFGGNNDGNVNLGRPSHLFYHVTQKTIEGCSYGLSGCSAIPEELYEKTPKPTNERVTIFNATRLPGLGYATTLPGMPDGEKFGNAFQKLTTTLDKKDLLVSGYAGFFFRETYPFDTSDEPWYIAYWKKRAESGSEASDEEDTEMPTEGQTEEKTEDEKGQEMPTAVSECIRQGDSERLGKTEDSGPAESAEYPEREHGEGRLHVRQQGHERGQDAACTGRHVSHANTHRPEAI
uniref:Uncharacterized protein n=1 Tax=Branchiostoma floridae TaxID=7739 RepID=C3Y2Z2_BRAFL|eukprot:XP_002609394.1 hypothetical protein BRAFLDRAFT_124618 [Branchiostoma floridae]